MNYLLGIRNHAENGVCTLAEFTHFKETHSVEERDRLQSLGWKLLDSYVDDQGATVYMMGWDMGGQPKE